MIVQELIILEDGGRIIETRSDSGFMIRQDETGILYETAGDPEALHRTYTETDIPIETEEEESEPSEAEEILSILLGEG